MTLLSQVTLLALPIVAFALSPPLVVQDGARIQSIDDIRVPVTLGVMSKCPDAVLWFVHGPVPILQNEIDYSIVKIHLTKSWPRS